MMLAHIDATLLENVGKAVPINGRVAEHFTPNDYPEAAIDAHEEGTVRTKLAVNADGEVVGCTILITSKSVALDAATCRIATERARFTSVRGGHAVAAMREYILETKWDLPAQPLVPWQWRAVVNFSRGSAISCERLDKAEDWDFIDCDRIVPSNLLARLLGNKYLDVVSVEIVKTRRLDSGNVMLPSSTKRTIRVSESVFSIGSDGRVSACETRVAAVPGASDLCTVPRLINGKYSGSSAFVDVEDLVVDLPTPYEKP